MFDKLFGKGHKAEVARRAEASGDLARAAQLYVDAELPEEAARVMILRGDGEATPRARLIHYTQAAATAPKDHEVARDAVRKRALLIVALAGDGSVTEAVRHDLLAAAADLERVGDPASAARAYARAGDDDGEARALASAGDVEGLEAALFDQHMKESEERKQRGAHREVETLVASGRRSEAARLATEAGLAERATQILARRVHGSVVQLELHGQPMAMVLGDEVVIGRSEGALQVASAAISRRHLSIARAGAEVVVRDLGSRNGTLLRGRGLAIAGAVPIGDGIELQLGKEVPLRVEPSRELPGAVSIAIAGAVYVAPLGPARLGIGAWRLERSRDGEWVELVTDDDPPAFAAGIRVVSRASLLVGDAFGTARGGEPALRVLAKYDR